MLATGSAVSSVRDENRQAALPPIRKGARTLNPLGKDGTWWFEKGDLILTGNDKVDEILAVIDGKRPSAVNHPMRAELAKPESGFEPVAAGFLDMAGLPPLPPEAAKLGLDGAKRIDVRWGFQDDALLSVLRVVALRRGEERLLLEQPTFGIRPLPPLPSDLTGFTVLSVDLVKTYDQVVALMKLASPDGADRVTNFETLARSNLDLNCAGDLFRNVNPKIAFYAQPTPPKPETNPQLALFRQFVGLTISVQVRDQVAAGKAVDSLVESINTTLKQQRRGASCEP